MVHQNYLKFLIYTIGTCVLLANATGVPQAVTKSPVEANSNSCGSCHDNSNAYNPTLALTIKDGNDTVSVYEAGKTYDVIIKIMEPTARGFGFQMSCIDSINLQDKGDWGTLGQSVKLQNLNVRGTQRKYIVQSQIRNDGEFTAQWKAPTTDLNPITFYYTGLAVNRNGNTNGDRNVFDKLTIHPQASTSTENDLYHKTVFYPNPGSEDLYFTSPNVKQVKLVNIATGNAVFMNVINNSILINDLNKGVYHIYDMSYPSLQISLGSFIKI